jgi:hypothetical protein
MSSRWYEYYGDYFTPMEYYPGPTYWLTDFVLASALEAAYLSEESERQYDDVGDEYYHDAAPITSEVREAIAQEVDRQLEEERSQAELYSRQGSISEATPFLQSGRVFVVSAPLEVLADDEPCDLSQGDVLRLERLPLAGEVTAKLRVLSSKSEDCDAGSRVLVSVGDLQEMYNSFRENVDSGLEQLKSSQGTGEIPPAPETALAVAPGPGAEVAAPDEGAASSIAEIRRRAAEAEEELDRELAEDDGMSDDL